MITDERLDDLCMLVTYGTQPYANRSVKAWRIVKTTQIDELLAWAMLAPFIFTSNRRVFYWKETRPYANMRTSTVTQDTPLLRPIDGHTQWVQSHMVGNKYQLHAPAWERLILWIKTSKN